MTTSTVWLAPSSIELNVSATTKAETLERLARRLSANGSPYPTVFEALRHREHMGCTGLGHGVALPHARLPHLTGPFGVFFRLERAIEFDAPDGEPVDLVLGLLLPAEGSQHQLQLLAHIAGLMAEAAFRSSLRSASDAAAVARLFALDPPA